MNRILFLVFVLILSSCNSAENQKQIDNATERARKTKEQTDSMVLSLKIFQKNIKEVSSKYKVQYKWDELSFKYSYQYLPVIESQYQIIEEYTINDIKVKDSTYVISLNCGNGNLSFPLNDLPSMLGLISYSFSLIGTRDMVNQITNEKAKCFLLVKVDTIYKSTEIKFKGRGRIIEVFH